MSYKLVFYKPSADGKTGTITTEEVPNLYWMSEAVSLKLKLTSYAVAMINTSLTTSIIGLSFYNLNNDSSKSGSQWTHEYIYPIDKNGRSLTDWTGYYRNGGIDDAAIFTNINVNVPPGQGLVFYFINYDEVVFSFRFILGKVEFSQEIPCTAASCSCINKNCGDDDGCGTPCTACADSTQLCDTNKKQCVSCSSGGGGSGGGGDGGGGSGKKKSSVLPIIIILSMIIAISIGGYVAYKKGLLTNLKA